jgi:quercetin dioxygenase-like cupin family protein
MKTLLSTFTWALAVLTGFVFLGATQTTGQVPFGVRDTNKARVVAVNTNQLPVAAVESGAIKIIASSEDANGAFAVIERTQDPCYKTTWHRHDAFEETFYVLEGIWTVQIADRIHEFPAGSYVLIPRGTPHGQGNFTHKPVRLLVIVAPGGFERFYEERAELFKSKGHNEAELQAGLEALRRKYVQVIDYTWAITKECRD